MSSSLLQLLSGAGGTSGAGGARSARIISSDGTPLEVFIGSSTLTGSGSDAGGLFGALGGLLSGPVLASNPGDYAFGNLSTIINQLMQNDPNRVRAAITRHCRELSRGLTVPLYVSVALSLERPSTAHRLQPRTSWRSSQRSRSRSRTSTRAPSVLCAKTSLRSMKRRTSSRALTRSTLTAYSRGSSRYEYCCRLGYCLEQEDDWSLTAVVCGCSTTRAPCVDTSSRQTIRTTSSADKQPCPSDPRDAPRRPLPLLLPLSLALFQFTSTSTRRSLSRTRETLRLGHVGSQHPSELSAATCPSLSVFAAEMRLELGM